MTNRELQAPPLSPSPITPVLHMLTNASHVMHIMLFIPSSDIHQDLSKSQTSSSIGIPKYPHDNFSPSISTFTRINNQSHQCQLPKRYIKYTTASENILPQPYRHRLTQVLISHAPTSLKNLIIFLLEVPVLVLIDKDEVQNEEITSQLKLLT